MAIVNGTNGNDTGLTALNGTPFADTINGFAGNDQLFGLAGNDILIGGAGNDTINGGGDGDTATYSDSTDAITVTGMTKVVTSGASGPAFTDTLVSVEVIWGSNLGDTFFGGAGVDNHNGRDGSDTFWGSAGPDQLFGGTGTDLVTYRDSLAAVTVDLTTNVNTGGDANGDRLVDIENVVGSAFSDTIAGNGLANRLFGGLGADTLRGAGGNDVILGGFGKDILFGGGGADKFQFALGDGGSSKANADEIFNFSRAAGDKIDLSVYGDNGSTDVWDFTFVGNNVFTAQHQVRYFQENGDTIIALNLTGASTPEEFIRLDGLYTLIQSDFVL